MGNKSSRYVYKYEHRLQLEAILRTLTDLQHDLRQHKDDVGEKNKSTNIDIKSLKDFNESQKKWFLSSEREVELMKKDVSRLKELDEVKMSLRKLNTEHSDDRVKLQRKLKEMVATERQTWDAHVFELRERYETMRKYSMELISMDLSHEREIKDLQNRISNIERKNVNMLKKEVNISPSCISPNRSTLISPNASYNGNEGNPYELKFSKINMAMNKLKEDIKVAEIKKSRSHMNV